MSPQRIWKTGGNRTKVVKDNKGNKGRGGDWEGNVVAKQFGLLILKKQCNM